MDSTTSLSLEHVASDSPVHRAALSRFEAELDHFIRWSESYLAIVRHYTKEVVKANEAMSAIINKLPEISLNQEKSIWQFSANSLQTIYHAKAKLVDDVIELVMEPLEGCLKELRESKTGMKAHNSLREKYDNALARYGSLSKSKEGSALREEALVLYEFRKQYIRADFEVTHRVLLLRDRINHLIPSRMLSYINAHAEFHKAASEIHEGLTTTMNQLRPIEDTETKQRSLLQLEAKRKALEEGALSKARPPDNTSTLDFPPALEKGPSRYLASPSGPSTASDGAVEKEGYLFKRVPGKSWARRYFKLEKGAFFYLTMSQKNPGTVLATPAVNILLCSVRVVRNEERRFCFELSTVYNKHVLLQAETEEELASWVSSFEASKRNALVQVPIGTAVSDWTIGDGSHEEEEDGIPLHKISDPGHTSIPQGNEEDDEEDDEVNDSEAVQDGSETENDIQYHDAVFRKENLKLHRLLRQVPRNDCVIDAFTCAWRKEIAVHGKLYLTYDRLCFYSNILGFVNMLVMNLRQVTSVILRRGPLYSSILVTTHEGTHTFKAFLKDDLRFATIKAVWQNATQEPRVSPQELYEAAHPRKAHQRSSVTHAEPTNANDDEMRESDTRQSGEQAVESKYNLPLEIPDPNGEVPCGCGSDHLEQKDADVVFQVPAKQLFDTMFDDTGSFWTQRYHPKRGETGRTQTPWTDQVREVRFIMPVNNAMVKLKETEVHITQTLIKNSQYLAYVVESRSETPALPYGDSFNTLTRYCITWVSKTSCRLVMTCGIQWFKHLVEYPLNGHISYVQSPMVKGMIRKAAMAGMAESSEDTTAILRQELEAIKGSNAKSDGSGAAQILDGAAKGASTSGSGRNDGRDAHDTKGSKSQGTSWTSSEATCIVLLALLFCSLVGHGVTWWRGAALHTAPLQATITESEMSSLNTMNRPKGERERFFQFLSAHSSPNASQKQWNDTASAQARLVPGVSTVRFMAHSRTQYRDQLHKGFYLRLANLQAEVRMVMEETVGVLNQVLTAERELTEAMFLNWLADGLVGG